MSAVEFYLEKGYTPKNKTITIEEAAAVRVWAVNTSTRLALTDLTISANQAGTIAFYWGNVGGTKIAEFLLAGSATITPSIGVWENPTYDRSLFATSISGATDGVRVDLTGFEIPQF